MTASDQSAPSADNASENRPAVSSTITADELSVLARRIFTEPLSNELRQMVREHREGLIEYLCGAGGARLFNDLEHPTAREELVELLIVLAGEQEIAENIADPATVMVLDVNKHAEQMEIRQRLADTLLPQLPPHLKAVHKFFEDVLKMEGAEPVVQLDFGPLPELEEVIELRLLGQLGLDPLKLHTGEMALAFLVERHFWELRRRSPNNDEPVVRVLLDDNDLEGAIGRIPRERAVAEIEMFAGISLAIAERLFDWITGVLLIVQTFVDNARAALVVGENAVDFRLATNPEPQAGDFTFYRHTWLASGASIHRGVGADEGLLELNPDLLKSLNDWATSAPNIEISPNSKEVLRHWRPGDSILTLVKHAVEVALSEFPGAADQIYRSLLAFSGGGCSIDQPYIRVLCLSLARIALARFGTEPGAQYCRLAVNTAEFSPFLFELAPGALLDPSQPIGPLFERIPHRIEEVAPSNSSFWRNLTIALHLGNHIGEFAEIVPQLATFDLGIKFLLPFLAPTNDLFSLERTASNNTVLRMGLPLLRRFNLIETEHQLDGDPSILEDLFRTIQQYRGYATPMPTRERAQQVTRERLIILKERHEFRLNRKSAA